MAAQRNIQTRIPRLPVETRRRLKSMESEDLHPRDEELLMAADGELSGRRASRVRAHLAACWDCRARMAEIEDTVADFVRVHRRLLGPELPPNTGAHGRLKARLAELAITPHADPWPWFFRFGTTTRVAAYTCVMVLTIAVISKFVVHHRMMSTSNRTVISSESSEAEVVPNRILTPGSVRQVAVADVCVTAHEEVVKAVPASLRQLVFQEYGIANAHADNYEIDYLITPGLGGADDIRNLWPEPNASLVWSSHVKDALEERLHQLVCSGKLDLPSAQREIANDWIAAYKKYFPNNEPNPVGLESE
jgi:hypothetical protein